MIIGRNKTYSTRAQFSALKALLKWRDYVARLEDESTGYVMPNHVLFQIGKDLPVTMNELRDCCRTNMTPTIMKYQREIIELVADKVERSKTKKVNTHVKLLQEEVGEKKMEEVEVEPRKALELTALVQSEFHFTEAVFPTYEVTLKKLTAISSIYGPTHNSSLKKPRKSSTHKKASLESQQKSLDDNLSHLDYYSLLKTLTGCHDVTVIEQTAQTHMPPPSYDDD